MGGGLLSARACVKQGVVGGKQVWLRVSGVGVQQVGMEQLGAVGEADGL
ncbi:hypothetical protein GCM10010171_34490 [Actinokineospora fastidiosa]|uniref:Uncharacterized protein n=1 Tax=Actinokineospora fastidiosa TaxID=1816 RepID=A0A918GIB4_9PSEU|nr:hypothetical protein GCM10010171_34490 [Actinokineospora fastidiosa]